MDGRANRNKYLSSVTNLERNEFHDQHKTSCEVTRA